MDVKLNFEECGKGPYLVLLHGNSESCRYFDRLVPFLAKHYHIIAIDTRGHGASQRGKAPFTLEQFACDLYDFLCLHQIKKASILGFSDGANVALLFAMKHGHMVDNLILNGGNLSPGGVKPMVQLPILLAYGLLCLISPFDKKAIAKKELLGLMTTQPHIDPARLVCLDMPVMVIAGTRDMIRDSHTRAIADAIPGARLRIIEGDHFIAARSAEAFSRHVLDFLSHGRPVC